MTSKIELLKKRDFVFRAIREFFQGHDFVELHTPLLVKNPGLEPYLQYFECDFVPDMGGGKREHFYLPTSPEYHLKKALALGLNKIFEITKSFRNGEQGPRHEPEFFMLEWYRAPGTYFEIANDFAALLKCLGEKFAPSKAWGHRQDLKVCDAFTKYTSLDLSEALDFERSASTQFRSLTRQALEKNFGSIRPDDDFETCFNKILVEFIEPKLGFEGPLFFWDYPALLCALARVSPEDSRYCERFEVYWEGVEIANAFGELTDPVEQRKRQLNDMAQRERLYGKTPPLDEELLSAIGVLTEGAGGIAVGLDRLVQLLLGASSIQDVIAFPHVKKL